MRTGRLRAAKIFAACLLLFAAGCARSGPELAPLAGLVTVDGKPLGGAALIFAADDGGRLGQAICDEQGRFEAWTFKPGDGALVGRHRIAVTHDRIVEAAATPEGLEGNVSGPVRSESSLPSRYGDVKTSGLTVEVRKGENNFLELALAGK